MQLNIMWNHVRNEYQNIFENNPHIFKYNVTFTERDLDSAIGSLNKVRRLTKHSDCREEGI